MVVPQRDDVLIVDRTGTVQPRLLLAAQLRPPRHVDVDRLVDRVHGDLDTSRMPYNATRSASDTSLVGAEASAEGVMQDLVRPLGDRRRRRDEPAVASITRTSY
jgi:hypothetical protein